MSIESDETTKRWIVDHSVPVRGAAPSTRQTLVSVGVVRRLGPDERLFRHGEPASHIALVGEGHVRLWRPIAEGRARIAGYRSLGEIVGENALGGAAIHEESAQAMTDVELLVAARDVVQELLATDPALSAAARRLLATRHHAAEEQVGALLWSSVEERLASFLLAAAARWGISEPRGVRIGAPLTHAELASVVGSTRETITLTLGNLRRAGAITLDRRRVIVLQRDALEAAASGARQAHRGGGLAGAVV